MENTMDYQKILTEILQAEIESGREIGAQVCLMKGGRILADGCVGNLVKTILETPDHLVIPDVTIQPMVQDITPF